MYFYQEKNNKLISSSLPASDQYMPFNATELSQPDVQFIRQIRKISELRIALKVYYHVNAEYPSTLESLLPSDSSSPKKYTELTEIPMDEYTGKLYEYSVTKPNDYSLAYVIISPTTKPSEAAASQFIAAYLKDVVDGNNHATAKFLSYEKARERGESTP